MWATIFVALRFKLYEKMEALMNVKIDAINELEQYLFNCSDIEKIEVLSELAVILPFYGLSLESLKQYLPDQLQIVSAKPV